MLYQAHSRYDRWAGIAPNAWQAWVLGIVLEQPLASSLEKIQDAVQPMGC